MPKVSTFSRANAVHHPKVMELDDILEGIKNGKWRKQIDELRKLEGAAFQEKKKLLPGFTVSGLFSERNDAGLTELSGFLQCDVDAKDNPGRKFAELRNIVINCENVYAAFRSPSGRGIKALVKCKPDKETHAGSHMAVVQYLADRGVKVDERVCALSQLCFISHDPHLYLNKSAKTIAPVAVDKTVEATLVEYEETRSDEEILAACEKAWPDVFPDLWAGEQGDDPSAADHQLIAILRENCFSNDRVVELFEQSGLYRPEKWKGRTHSYVMRSLSRCSAVQMLNVLPVVPEDPADPSPERKKKGGWSWETAADIPEWKPEDDKYIIKRLLYESTVTCIYGAPGSGKTFCVFSMAAAVTTGIDWHGNKVRQGAVMYMGLEGHEGVKKRIQAMKLEGHLTDKSEALFARVKCEKHAMNLLDKDHVRKAVEMVGAYEAECGQKVKMLIIDTLARATPGGDENSTQDMGVAVIHAQLIANRTGCSVILVHHSNKMGQIRGSTALPAAFDCVYEVARNTENPVIREFDVRKSRDEGDQKKLYFKLRIIRLGVDLDGEDVTSCLVEFLEEKDVPLKRDKAQVDQDHLLSLIPAEGITFKELMQTLGITRGTLQRRLHILGEEGSVRKDGNTYFPMFQELDDDDPTRDL